MAFGGFNDNNQPAPMADINVTPMVDVMLVLLVIFIITAPLFTHAIKLDLPSAQSAPAPEKPLTITVSIDAQGMLYWTYAPIAQVMASAQSYGMTKLGFVTDPKDAAPAASAATPSSSSAK